MPGSREPRPCAGRRVLARLDEAHEDRPPRQVLRGRTGPRAVWRRERFGERCSPAGQISGGQAFAHEREPRRNRGPPPRRLPPVRPSSRTRAAAGGPATRPAATHWSGSRAGAAQRRYGRFRGHGRRLGSPPWPQDRQDVLGDWHLSRFGRRFRKSAESPPTARPFVVPLQGLRFAAFSFLAGRRLARSATGRYSI